MNEITETTVFRRVELPGSRIQDELVFVDLEVGKYYATGSVGADIWDYLADPRSLDALCTHLTQLYDIERDTCESDVRAFLGQVLQAGLIEPA